MKQVHPAKPVENADVLSLGELLDRKFENIVDWLVEHGNGAGRGLAKVEAEGFEQGWHYGYAAALRDIRLCLGSDPDPLN